MPELSIMKENKMLSEWSLDDKEIMIGRGSDCHIALQDPLVSWHHAKIVKAYGGYLVEDLGSTNGVTVNNHRISNKQMLKYGDTIRVGTHELHFKLSIGDKYSVPTEKTVGIESLGMGSPSPSPQKYGGRACVHLLTGADSGTTKSVGSICTVGKPGASLAVVTMQGDVYTLKRLTGEYPTLNRKPIANEGSQLRSGDAIQVGEDKMTFLIE